MKKQNKIYSEGNTFFNIENNYNVKSSNVFYERKKLYLAMKRQKLTIFKIIYINLKINFYLI